MKTKAKSEELNELTKAVMRWRDKDVCDLTDNEVNQISNLMRQRINKYNIQDKPDCLSYCWMRLTKRLHLFKEKKASASTFISMVTNSSVLEYLKTVSYKNLKRKDTEVLYSYAKGHIDGKDLECIRPSLVQPLDADDLELLSHGFDSDQEDNLLDEDEDEK